MAALHTSVELGRGFVPAPGLQEPPEGLVVAALRAFDLCGGQGVELGLLVPHDLDLGSVGEFLLGYLHHCVPLLLGVAAVVADQGHRDLAATFHLLQLKPGAALRTEFQLEAPPRAFLTPSKSSLVVSMALSTLLANAFSGLMRWALTLRTSFLISGCGGSTPANVTLFSSSNSW